MRARFSCCLNGSFDSESSATAYDNGGGTASNPIHACPCRTDARSPGHEYRLAPQAVHVPTQSIEETARGPTLSVLLEPLEAYHLTSSSRQIMSTG